MSRKITQKDLQAIGSLICELGSLGKALTIYGADHPRTQESWVGYESACSVVAFFSVRLRKMNANTTVTQIIARMMVRLCAAVTEKLCRCRPIRVKSRVFWPNLANPSRVR